MIELSTPMLREAAQATLDVHVRNPLIDVCALCKIGNWPCAAHKTATYLAELASLIDQQDAERIEWSRVLKETADAAKVTNDETIHIKEAVGRALGLVARDAPTIIAELDSRDLSMELTG